MIVIRGTLSTMTLRLRAFLIDVWLFTVRLMEIAKETAAFQIMHKDIATSQFLWDEMLKLNVLASYAHFGVLGLFGFLVLVFFFFHKLIPENSFFKVFELAGIKSILWKQAS